MRRADVYAKNAAFYSRQRRFDDPSERMSQLEYDGGILGYGGCEVLKLEWTHGDKYYACFVDQERIPLTKKYFNYKVSTSICDFIGNLYELTAGCTNDSVRDFLAKYPYTYHLVNRNFLGDSELGRGDNYLVMGSFCASSELMDKAKLFAFKIDKMLVELANMQLDTRKLVRREPFLKDSDIKIPKWVKVAAAVGTVVVIKVIVKSIGQDVNIEIPEFDGDVDVDVEVDDNNEFLSNSYNVSFGAQSETLTSKGGGQQLPVTITKEPGSANLFCIESNKGVVHNVKGGTTFVDINGISYRLPKLKG